MLDVPHGKGTIVFGNGSGGGIQRPERADKYEGEFDSGFAHGMGQYSSTSKGRVYRGEYSIGQRHGCGAEYDINPFLKRVDQGENPEEAWKATKDDIQRKAKYGTWLRDAFFTGPDDSGRWCHIKEIQGTIQEVREVVAKVRMFQHKPDGEVTFRFAQDAAGLPAPVMQDPLHYPHGTAFLAPGPLGQCHPIPDSPHLKHAMSVAASNHEKIHDAYNLPYDPEPGSDMDKAMKLWKRKEAKEKRALEKKLQREQQRLRRLEGALDGEPEKEEQKRVDSKTALTETAKPKEEEEEEEGDLSEDDLIASAFEIDTTKSKEGSNNSAPPSIVASVSMGLSKAFVAAQRAFNDAAIRAPPRRCLTRPRRKTR